MKASRSWGNVFGLSKSVLRWQKIVAGEGSLTACVIRTFLMQGGALSAS